MQHYQYFQVFKSTSFLNLVKNMIYDYKLHEPYPYIEITIKVFLSMNIIITRATCERIYRKYLTKIYNKPRLDIYLFIIYFLN